MTRVLHGALACAAYLLLAACAHPSDKAISSFADSAVAVTSILSSASDLAVELDGKTKTTEAATGYVAGDLDFPPAPGTLLDGKIKDDWAVRISVMKAISGYAKALAEANDPALSKSISETASSLSVTLANFETTRLANDPSFGAAQAAARSQQIQIAGGIIGDVLGFATELYTGARIHEVLVKVHPTLEQARDLLKKDFVSLANKIGRKKNDHQIALVKKLEAHAKDTRLTSIQRYDLYTAAAVELAGLGARVEVLLGASKALDGMVAAHRALIDDRDDKRALSAFIEVTKALADKVKKLRDLEKSARSS
jgi:hypothetical protein